MSPLRDMDSKLSQGSLEPSWCLPVPGTSDFHISPPSLDFLPSTELSRLQPSYSIPATWSDACRLWDGLGCRESVGDMGTLAGSWISVPIGAANNPSRYPSPSMWVRWTLLFLQLTEEALVLTSNSLQS